jgi:hypothetical protein
MKEIVREGEPVPECTKRCECGGTYSMYIREDDGGVIRYCDECAESLGKNEAPF